MEKIIWPEIYKYIYNLTLQSVINKNIMFKFEENNYDFHVKKK
jgi:hypothetical protein